MWGTRFLSVFLKVNPYFTLALAVGFSGIATVGFNHVETEKALSKLIPLHLRSLFTDASSEKIVSDVPEMNQALQVIHSLSQSGTSVPSQPSFAQVLKSDPLTPREGNLWQDLGLAGLNVPAAGWFLPGLLGLPDHNTPTPDQTLTKTTPTTDYPDPAPSQSPPQPPLAIGPGLFIPQFAPPVFGPPPPSVNIVQSYTVPLPSVVTPIIPPGPSTGPSSGGTTVGVAEPSMAVTFAVLLPLLAGLRRRTAKHVAG